MKIVFLSALYPPHTRGGGELSTHYIAQGLRELGHEIVVITEQGESGDYEIDDIPVVRLPIRVSGKPLLEKRASRKIAQSLREKLAQYPDIDVIHAHDFRMALALAQLQLPTAVVTNRDYAQICGSTNNLGKGGGPCPGCTWRNVWGNHRVAEASFPRNLFRAWQFAYNMNYRRASYQLLPHQIFISHAQQQIIAQQNNLTGIHQGVIYNPVPPDYLLESTIPSGNDLLYVGTVEWYKGVGLLLEAFREVAKKFPTTNLKIAGEGADRWRYEALVSSWGMTKQVVFLGRIPWDQLRALYDQVGIVVAPSIWIEPFGRTVIEAMARGKVVVAANHGGPGEVIQNNETGLLFTAQSVPSLQEQLVKALQLASTKQSSLQTKARGWVAQHLTTEKISQRHVAFYQKIVAK